MLIMYADTDIVNGDTDCLYTGRSYQYSNYDVAYYMNMRVFKQ